MNNSYQGSNELKSRFVAHVERHRLEDRVLQGTYGKLVGGEWKGCAVGCSLRSLDEIDGVLDADPLSYQSNHQGLSERLGIPLVLSRLEDAVFEGLSETESLNWPSRFAAAIPVGRDLSGVWDKLALWMLRDPTSGVLRLAKRTATQTTIADVAALYERKIAGDTPTSEEWRKARSAAYAASACAYAASASADSAAYAYAAAYAAAAYAYASADSASADYASAASDYAASASAASDYAASDYAASASAASAADARQLHWLAISHKLCELMAAA